MTRIDCFCRPAPTQAPTRRFFIWQHLGQMLALRRQRAQLRQLEVGQLRDIGITRQDALAEAARPFWDPPWHWRD